MGPGGLAGSQLQLTSLHTPSQLYTPALHPPKLGLLCLTSSSNNSIRSSHSFFVFPRDGFSIPIVGHFKSWHARSGAALWASLLDKSCYTLPKLFSSSDLNLLGAHRAINIKAFFRAGLHLCVLPFSATSRRKAAASYLI